MLPGDGDVSLHKFPWLNLFLTQQSLHQYSNMHHLFPNAALFFGRTVTGVSCGPSYDGYTPQI